MEVLPFLGMLGGWEGHYVILTIYRGVPAIARLAAHGQEPRDLDAEVDIYQHLASVQGELRT